MGYNEADTRAKLINPKLYEAGWSEDLIRRETADGTVEIINGETTLQSRLSCKNQRCLQDNKKKGQAKQTGIVRLL